VKWSAGKLCAVTYGDSFSPSGSIRVRAYVLRALFNHHQRDLFGCPLTGKKLCIALAKGKEEKLASGWLVRTPYSASVSRVGGKISQHAATSHYCAEVTERIQRPLAGSDMPHHASECPA
jgi:hypothetical protein